MGVYVNPPFTVKDVGRQLVGARDYESLARQLRDGEVLVGLFDRGIFFNAPHLFSAAEFEEFDKQYRSGMFLSASYWAVPRAVVYPHEEQQHDVPT